MMKVEHLSWAASFNHEGVVKLLLGHRAVDTTTCNKNGRIALEDANHRGHEGIANLLREHERSRGAGTS